MNALAVADMPVGRSGSKKAFSPFRVRDWLRCMPEPLAPSSGFGMKVACQPSLTAYSLTTIFEVMRLSAASSAPLARRSSSCWDCLLYTSPSPRDS